MGNHQNSVIFIIGVIAVLLGSVETPGRSQNSSQAVTNFGPLPVLIKLAEQGDAKAQHRLGLIYFLGQGVPKDDAEGLKWFRKAADQGLADAQAMLGAYYREHKEWAEAIK